MMITEEWDKDEEGDKTLLCRELMWQLVQVTAVEVPATLESWLK